MKRIMACLVVGLALAGCQDKNSYFEPSKSIDKMSPDELCTFYAHYRENPDLSAHGKEIATQQMRAKNCPGA